MFASTPATADGGGGRAVTQVLCCRCGILIVPNASNTCATCLASTSDITRGISSEVTLHQCRGCLRWHKEAGKWMTCELESRELMALCLANVSGLRNKQGSQQQKVRLVDAAWIWTEPHSMRLKVRLTIQREIETGTILQQSFTVVFIVRNQQCVDCQAQFRQGSWKSLVQVRQRVSHKRTFLYLEQLILKHDAHRGCLSIETFRDGMDFYFPDKGKAARFISFLESVCPIKVKTSKKLISTNDKSNVANFKYTNFVEICPLCKDDLLFLPAKLARSMGSISRLVLVKKVSNVIHVVDPRTGQTASMAPEVFWRDPFRPLVTAARSRMTRYTVLGKEAYLDRHFAKRTPHRKQRSRLASLTLAREHDLGVNNRQAAERSHVGYLLKAGDVCLGYDLRDTQLVDDTAEQERQKGQFPDVIVIRKLYGAAAAAAAATVASTDDTGMASSTMSRRRIWRLQRLDMDVNMAQPKSRGARGAAGAAADEDDMDEEDFMQEVEADKEMRLNMNLYKSPYLQDKLNRRQNVEGQAMETEVQDDEDDDEDDDQKIQLEELLDGLELDAGPDNEGDTGGNRNASANTEQVKDDGGDISLGQMAAFTEGEKAAKEGIAYVSREDARFVRDKDNAVAVSSGVMGKEYQKNLPQRPSQP